MVSFSQPKYPGKRSGPASICRRCRRRFIASCTCCCRIRWRSTIHWFPGFPGHRSLRLEVLERHPYTTFFRLTYEFTEDDDRNYAPDAHIRFYHDAHMAEATSFKPARAAPARPIRPTRPRQLLQQAWRRNRALDRWLDYLLRQGHSRGHHAARAAAPSRRWARKPPYWPKPAEARGLTGRAQTINMRRLLRGHSSAGRALAWHARGRRFDPAWLHQLSPSSRGLGHRPFTAATGVRIP